MVLFNYSTRELTAKVVYYGPGLCGKTTNLQYIYDNLPGNVKGKMLSLATKTDRTLFFDFLPIDLGEIRGMRTRIQLYTVPGQVFYNETRRLVLKGADGLVFVADSQKQMMDANLDSFRNLEENLKGHGMKLAELPLVLQFNKRDLPNVASIEDLNASLNKYNSPFYESIATTGIGVQDTLKAITKLVLLHLTRKYDVRRPPTPSVQPPAPPARVAPASPTSPARPTSIPLAREVPVAPVDVAARPAPPPAPVVFARSAPAPAATAVLTEPAAAGVSSALAGEEIVELVDVVEEPEEERFVASAPVPDLGEITDEAELLTAEGERQVEQLEPLAAKEPDRALFDEGGEETPAPPALAVDVPVHGPSSKSAILPEPRLEEVKEEDELFAPGARVVQLDGSGPIEAVIPVEVRTEGGTRRFVLSLRLSLSELTGRGPR